VGGGAWPFLVGGVNCQLNCDNERDSNLLNRRPINGSRLRASCGWPFGVQRRGLRGASIVGRSSFVERDFLEGLAASSRTKLSDNRSVMPLDVRGRTRATLNESTCVLPCPKGPGNPLNLARDRDRGL
jgi:hypothetical protein